jgi:hypothetical protein
MKDERFTDRSTNATEELATLTAAGRGRGGVPQPRGRGVSPQRGGGRFGASGRACP